MNHNRPPSKLMQLIAASAMIGGPMLLGRRTRSDGPPSLKPVNKRTDQDRENLRLAAERRKRKAEKRAEAIRRAKAGQKGEP